MLRQKVVELKEVDGKVYLKLFLMEINMSKANKDVIENTENAIAIVSVFATMYEDGLWKRIKVAQYTSEPYKSMMISLSTLPMSGIDTNVDVSLNGDVYCYTVYLPEDVDSELSQDIKSYFVEVEILPDELVRI